MKIPENLELVFDKKQKLLILREDGKNKFELKALSGQREYQETSWHSGKSPIPSNIDVEDETLYVWLKNPNQPGQKPDPRTGTGIGEFYYVSSRLSDKTRIWKYNYTAQRQFIGIHPDNKYPGSAGCIVLQHLKPEDEKKMIEFRNYIKNQLVLRQNIDILNLTVTCPPHTDPFDTIR